MLARHIGDYHFLADAESGVTFRWGRSLEDNPAFAPVPELADISISNKCSKGCAFCYKGSTPEGKVMSLEEYCQVLDGIYSPEYGTIFQVAIGGGEPLEHPNFVEIVDETVKRGIVLNFTTNGLLLTSNICEVIKGKVGAMAISAGDISGIKRIRSTIERAEGIKVNIHYILSGESIEEATAIVEGQYNHLLKGINAVVFLTYKPAGRAKENQLLRCGEKMTSFIQAVKAPKAICKIGFDACFVPMLIHDHAVRNEMVDACEGGFFSVYIDENMCVSPCSFSGGRDAYSLKDYDFYDIWMNKLQSYRDRVKNGCRRECVAHDLCRGYCQYYPQITSCFQR